MGEESSERYEYIPAQLLVIEDVCKKYACACTVKTATKPPQPIEKSTAGPSLLAQAIVSKVAIACRCAGRRRFSGGSAWRSPTTVRLDAAVRGTARSAVCPFETVRAEFESGGHR